MNLRSELGIGRGEKAAHSSAGQGDTLSSSPAPEVSLSGDSASGESSERDQALLRIVRMAYRIGWEHGAEDAADRAIELIESKTDSLKEGA